MCNGLYVLSTDSPTYNVTNKRLKISDVNKTYLWHCRLGHINETRISTLWKSGYLDRFDFHSYDVYESCLLGKMPKSPFTGKRDHAKDVLGLVHSDVYGPMSTQARGGYVYFITFTDDHSRYGYVFLMRHKSEAFDKFKEFRHEVEKQTGKSIKILRSDRGGEYLSVEFQDHLRENGILSQWTPPGTPQLNGVSERRNRTLLDMVRSMMSCTTLPISFWGYAIESAMFILNRVPSKSVEQTLYEIWTGKKPSFSYMKIWGCEAYVKRLDSQKLQPKSDKCLFVGYPKETKGYYFYHPQENKVFVALHAVFLEKEFINAMDSGRKVELDEDWGETRMDTSLSEPDQSHDDMVEPQPVTQEVRRAGRTLVDVNLIEDDEPTTNEEAILDIDFGKWLDAMKSEMDSMYANQIWILVEAPERIKPIGCKWV